MCVYRLRFSFYVKRAKKNKKYRGKKEAQAAADSEAAAQAVADSEAALKDYVDTYASMKPKDAAKVFDSMMPDQTDLVVKIFRTDDTGSEIGDLSQDDSHKLGGSYGENG